MSDLKDKLTSAFSSVPKRFSVGQKVFRKGSDIPYVVSVVNHMSYDLVYDINSEEYEKYKAIYNESFHDVDIMCGLGSQRVPNHASPHSSEDIGKAIDIIEFGSRWIVYDNELIAR